MAFEMEIEIVDLLCRGIDPRDGSILNTPRDPRLDRARLNYLERLNLAARAAKKINGMPRISDFPNSGKKWSRENESIVIREWLAGDTVDAIARVLGRSPGSIAARLVILQVFAEIYDVSSVNQSRGGFWKMDRPTPIKSA